MRIPYKDIPALAKTNTTLDIFDYNQQLVNIRSNKTSGDPTKINSYF